jgi:D-alanyl-D-alanine carboxypeptidase/D-alanyl-D-alanine-endopeptidase (penicillin-binding protein 4)
MMVVLLAAAPVVAQAAAQKSVRPPQSTLAKPLEKLPAPVLGAMRSAGLPLSSYGFFVREVGSAEPLLALNEDRPYVLASTTKVVTTMAALDLLGPNYRWRTYAFTKGYLAGGRLRGDLLIVGAGNALLSSEDMAQWFVKLQEQGLREITGNIVLDRYAFQLSERDHIHTPPPSADRPHHMWPDAFTLNEGVLRVEVQPARGKRAFISLVPPLADVKMVNNVSMSGGCWANAALRNKGGQLSLMVNGSWTKACGTRSIPFAPLSHADITTRAVAALWTQTGGVLHGTVIDQPLQLAEARGSAVMQQGTDGELLLPFSVHLSERLPQVLRDINKTSDNMASRNLLLSLSHGFPLRNATLASAQARMRRWLTGQGLAEGDIEIDNGSGLSRTERGKPRAMVHLLANAWNSPSAEAFVASLPIAGVDGTLAHRMQNGAATGQAHLKTGTLLDTRALAGYVRARSGKVYAVAAMVNHPRAALGRPALDVLIEWVAKNG